MKIMPALAFFILILALCFPVISSSDIIDDAVNNNESNNLSISFEVFEQHYEHKPYDELDVGYDISISYPQVYIPDNRSEQDYINSFIISVLLNNDNWEGFIHSEINIYEEDFDYDIARDYPYSYTWELERSIDIRYYDHGIIGLAYFYYVYMGGAHGYNETSYINIDLTRRQEIVLQDMFINGSEEALALIADGVIREDWDIGPDEDLSESHFFSDSIYLPFNFLIQEDSVLFTYHLYEIAPYACGEISFELDYDAINNYIDPEGPIYWARR